MLSGGLQRPPQRGAFYVGGTLAYGAKDNATWANVGVRVVAD
jgi:hypothetical protein